jgi:uncharacterized protein (TIGR02646 family)
MRRIQRQDLPAPTQKALDRKQAGADAKQASGILDIETTWKSARKTKPLKSALHVLQAMAGVRERCMYCGDSHGTDIEHFWPKRHHPDRMFRWPNLLLCCTECGRFKLDDFPLAGGVPLLVDPTAEDPWQFLDFEPVTGIIMPRFDRAAGDWSPKGTETVKALQLDRREALQKSYQKTYRRLKARVEAALQTAAPDAITLVHELHEVDDHGLLGWCFTGTGQNEEPFARLRKDRPDVWQHCVQSLA